MVYLHFELHYGSFGGVLINSGGIHIRLAG
jgi:hypothetical protein